MPGVPSGRGCEACRKQKKKCDQLKPACSRCSRLSLACVGGGEQRYKFKEAKEQSSALVLSSRSQTPHSRGSSSTPPILSRTPSSETVRVANAFIAHLEVTDIRYEISCYGLFLKDIPQRLGKNEALDASVVALSSTCTFLHTGQRTLDTYASYGKGLTALRECLNDPIKAQMPETMCAAYFLQICQAWVAGNDSMDGYMSHGEGIAHLLNNTASRGWHGSFEREVAYALIASVLIESIINPRIHLKPEVIRWTQPPDGQGIQRPERDPTKLPRLTSLKLDSIAKFPDFVRQPELYAREISYTYQQMLTDSKFLRSIMFKSPDTSSALIPTLSVYITKWKDHNNVLRAYGILLCLAPVLSSLLRIFNPNDFQLVSDMSWFSHEILAMAEYSLPLRPLGASYMFLPLVSLWAATDEPILQSKVQQLVLEFEESFPLTRWMSGAYWLRKKYERLRLELVMADLGKHADFRADDDSDFERCECKVQ